MFDGDSAKDKKIEKIMKFLNNNEYTKIHSRHIGIDKAVDIGLKIKPLEDDSVFARRYINCSSLLYAYFSKYRGR